MVEAAGRRAKRGLLATDLSREAASMKLGAALPHSGAAASPDGMVAFARRAEELGLDSLWVLERILRPVAPGREPLLPPHSASV
jgi:alkanesulfonate monooxygenase SsuD/methylene tetrahydromethanopterin reductase-like flavin-dependent oxidoreductase (luciferase family)